MRGVRNSNARTSVGTDLFAYCLALVVTGGVGLARAGQQRASVIVNGPIMATPQGGSADKGGGSKDKDSQSGGLSKSGNLKEALQGQAKDKKSIVFSPKIRDLGWDADFRKDVPFDQVLQMLRDIGLKWDEKCDIVRVYTKEEYKEINESKRLEVFHLSYVTAEEAMDLIAPVLSKGAIVKASPRTRKDEEKKQATAKDEENKQDTAKKSGEAASSSSPTTSSKIDSSESNPGGNASGGNRSTMQDVIVVYDYPDNLAAVEKAIKQLDRKPTQVLVEVTILTARLTEEMRLGVDWNLLTGVSVGGFPALQGGSGTPIATGGFTEFESRSGLRIGVSSGSLQGFIRALEAVTDITIRANPKILALNRQEASMQIGPNLAYRGDVTIGPQGLTTQGRVLFLQTGTQLAFTPYIDEHGYVRMDIYPKDSSAEFDSNRLPQEVATSLRTTILVKDRETIVIGGLFRDVITTTREQVPLLGDLPLIGRLFRQTYQKNGREEVMILLAPHIVRGPDETEGKATAADIELKELGSKDSLDPISRARIAEHCYAIARKCYAEGDAESAMRELSIALRLRPTYLDARRLQERIIADMPPDEVEKSEAIKEIEHRETQK
jgi:type II secretory pathway component GspD/PulD (secretin)